MTSNTNSMSSAHHSRRFQFGANKARTLALGTMILGGAIIGAPALSVGPSASNTDRLNPDTQIDDFHPSFDLVQVSTTLSDSHSSFGEHRAGPVTFPEGAIDVPWTSSIGTSTGRAFPQAPGTQLASTGSTYSVPTQPEARPQVINASLRTSQPDASAVFSNATRTSLVFDQTSTELSRDMTDTLDQLAVSLAHTEGRVVLRAFGGNTPEATSTSRRLALRRALAVRNYLMARGVNQNRMMVRAIGTPNDGGPADRVDLLIQGS